MASAKMRFGVALCALILSLARTEVARADFIDFVSIGDAEAYLTFGPYVHVLADIGQSVAQLSTTTNFVGDEPFNTFCVDLADSVNAGQVYAVQLQPTSDGLTNGNAIDYLYQTYGQATINAASYTETWGSNTATGNANDFAGGLQLAIWDLLMNNGLSPDQYFATYGTTAPLTYSAEDTNTTDFVSFFLNQALTNSTTGIWANSDIPQPDGYTVGQGFLIPSFATPAPEPSTLALAGLALTSLAVGEVRRRVRTARSAG